MGNGKLINFEIVDGLMRTYNILQQYIMKWV